jgi:hypothetical protein
LLTELDDDVSDDVSEMLDTDEECCCELTCKT